jgi:hypothetical protein
MSILKTVNECKLNIQNFANIHKLIFEEQGECGFGRECVGLTNGSNYVDYNPTYEPDYDYIEGFYDERFNDITPTNAYHKHSCIAVLGRGDDSIRQLSDWVDKLNEIGVKVEKYSSFKVVISRVFENAVRVA